MNIRQSMMSNKSTMVVVFVFSAFVNILMLSGAIFMLQVYDRVLASGSKPTLAVLFLLLTVLFIFLGAFDYLRACILSRVGAQIHQDLGERTFNATMRLAQHPQQRARSAAVLGDLENVQKFFASRFPFAIMDAPWSVLLFFLLFLFHWQLGLLALIGGGVLIALAFANQRFGKNRRERLRNKQLKNDLLQKTLWSDVETIQGLGMVGSMLRRWKASVYDKITSEINLGDISTAFQTSTRTLRLFLQSAMLGLGALLVLKGEASPGVMIASSILMGRALAPIDQIVGQWSVMTKALQSYTALNKIYEVVPIEQEKTDLDRPAGYLSAINLTVQTPDRSKTLLQGLTFDLSPGEALAVLGSSASGKSTLARALIGIQPLAAGELRLDGADLSQWEQDKLGNYLGYLPQDVTLFDGTIAQNITRLEEHYSSKDVIAAAQLANAHELILSLADGYDTLVGSQSYALSGGQRQRIGLARALYNSPSLVVLDEPNSNLDTAGEAALVEAVMSLKAARCTVIIMAHRPSIIAACDKLLVLENGRQKVFGPKENIIKQQGTSPSAAGPSQQADAASGERCPGKNWLKSTKELPASINPNTLANSPSISSASRSDSRLGKATQ